MSPVGRDITGSPAGPVGFAGVASHLAVQDDLVIREEGGGAQMRFQMRITEIHPHFGDLLQQVPQETIRDRAAGEMAVQFSVRFIS